MAFVIGYAADLHGNRAFYEQYLERCWRAGARMVLLGGDLLPHHAEGFDDPAADVAAQRAFVEQTLRPLLLRFARLAPEARVYHLPGNHDWRAVAPAFGALEADGLWHPLHEQAVELPGGHTLVGFGGAIPSPFPIKDWERPDRRGDPPEFPGRGLISAEDGATEWIDFETLLAQREPFDVALARLPVPRDPARAIYALHQPPHGTSCDVLFDGRHIGSRSLRAFVEARGPLLVLCGHIHESPYKTGSHLDRIGRSVICNPGAGEVRVHAVTFDLEDLSAGLDHTIFGRTQPFVPEARGGGFEIG